MKNANGVIKKLTSAERSYYTAAEVRERYDICCTLRLLPYATYKLMVFPFSP